MLDRHGLLGSALQKLNNTVSATNGSNGVPSVVRTKDKDDLSMYEKTDKTTPTLTGNSLMASLGNSIEKHGQSLVSVAKIDAQQKEKERVHQFQTEIRNTLRHLAGEKRSLMKQYAAETQKRNKVMVDAIMEQIKEIKNDIEMNNCELASLDTTPKKKNLTPESEDID